VCGIAKNPSIALGGSLIDIDSYILQWHEEPSVLREKNETQQSGKIMEAPKASMPSQTNIHNEVHYQLFSRSSIIK